MTTSEHHKWCWVEPGHADCALRAAAAQFAAEVMIAMQMSWALADHADGRCGAAPGRCVPVARARDLLGQCRGKTPVASD